MERDGIGRNREGMDRKGRDGMGSDGMGRDGMEWEGWDVEGRDGMATTHFPNYCLILERPHPHLYLFYLSENQPWIGLDYLKILLFHSIHVLVS